MQYLLIFAAVLLVVVGMNLFLFTAVRQMALRVKEQINSRIIRELSVFDTLYEEKEGRLRALEEEEALFRSNIFKKSASQASAVQEEAESPEGAGLSQTAVPARGGDIPVSRTANSDFRQEYRYVKRAFAQNGEELVRQVAALPPGPESAFGRRARQVLEELDGAAVCSLSTLDGEQQAELLRETLGEEAREFLEEYIRREAAEEAFSVLDFWSYAETMGQLYGDSLTVYTGGDEAFHIPGAQVAADPSICEGIRIVRGNKMYDYSL